MMSLPTSLFGGRAFPVSFRSGAYGFHIKAPIVTPFEASQGLDPELVIGEFDRIMSRYDNSYRSLDPSIRDGSVVGVSRVYGQVRRLQSAYAFLMARRVGSRTTTFYLYSGHARFSWGWQGYLLFALIGWFVFRMSLPPEKDSAVLAVYAVVNCLCPIAVVGFLASLIGKSLRASTETDLTNESQALQSHAIAALQSAVNLAKAPQPAPTPPPVASASQEPTARRRFKVE